VHLLLFQARLIIPRAGRAAVRDRCCDLLETNGAAAVPKFNAEVNVGAGKSRSATPAEPEEPQVSGAEAAATETPEADVVTTVTTIGVIGVAAALFDVALIPGIVIGVAAAYAPKYVTNIGDRLQPLFNYTVRGAYKMTRSARSAMAETRERMHDIAAEVEAEEAATEVNGAGTAHAAS
jgi:hypothetical protein